MLSLTVEIIASMRAQGSLLVCETLYAFCLVKNKWFPKQALSRQSYYFPFLPLQQYFVLSCKH